MTRCNSPSCPNGPTIFLDPLAAPELCAECREEAGIGYCRNCQQDAELDDDGLCEHCATEAELAEAFAPCHLAGHADNLDALYRQRAEIDRQIKVVKAIVFDASLKGADMSVTPQFRKGAVIEGKESISMPDGEVKTVRFQLVWHHNNDCNRMREHNDCWHPELEYAK